MYSDGLIERRGELITDGMDRLATAATVIATSGWPDNPAVTFASMLSDRGTHRRRRRAVPQLRGCRRRAHNRPACGYVTGWHVDTAPRTRRGEHARGAALGRGASARSSLRRLGLRRPADVRTGDERGTARGDPDVRHLAHPFRSHPDRCRRRQPAFPAIKDYGQDAATGRGLTLFDTLASNWGIQAVDGGKIVWFELPVDYPVRPTQCLGRKLPLRPDGHHALRPPRGQRRHPRRIACASRHPGRC